jgi:hypothetical protein
LALTRASPASYPATYPLLPGGVLAKGGIPADTKMVKSFRLDGDMRPLCRAVGMALSD